MENVTSDNKINSDNFLDLCGYSGSRLESLGPRFVANATLAFQLFETSGRVLEMDKLTLPSLLKEESLAVAERDLELTGNYYQSIGNNSWLIYTLKDLSDLELYNLTAERRSSIVSSVCELRSKIVGLCESYSLLVSNEAKGGEEMDKYLRERYLVTDPMADTENELISGIQSVVHAKS